MIRTVAVTVVLPPEAEVPCTPLAKYPDRKLTDKETGDALLKTRSDLKTCEQRRAAAVAAVKHPMGHQ